jgi:hypothetical protein
MISTAGSEQKETCASNLGVNKLLQAYASSYWFLRISCQV